MRVAVTGIGLRTPIGSSTEEVFQSLINMRTGVRPHRIAVLGERPVATVEGYDERSERALHLALDSSKDAIRNAGLHQFDGLLVLGCSKGEILSFERASSLFHQGVCGDGFSEAFASFPPSSVAQKVAEELGSSEVLSVPAACSSGSLAIAKSARKVATGACDAVLCGGTEASITPFVLASFENLGVLSRSACRPFDRRREGFVVGEGSAFLLLESEEHAKKRGAHIHAWVDGWASACDTTGLVTQSMDGRSLGRLIRRALQRASCPPEELDYINAHGSATRLNDIVETRGIKHALSEHTRTVPVSGTKGFTGHILGATGAVEAVLCIVALLHGFVPPTYGLEEPDPECDLEHCHSPREATLKTALSISSGFGGQMVCLVLRKA